MTHTDTGEADILWNGRRDNLTGGSRASASTVGLGVHDMGSEKTYNKLGAVHVINTRSWIHNDIRAFMFRTRTELL